MLGEAAAAVLVWLGTTATAAGDGGVRGCRAHARCRVARAAILHRGAMRLIGVLILGASLVLALRAVETQQALREIGDARVEIRC